MSKEPKVEEKAVITPLGDVPPPPPPVAGGPIGEVYPPLPQPENAVPIPPALPEIQPPSGIGV